MSWIRGMRPSRAGVRVRLAALLTALFVVAGAILLTASYALVKSNLNMDQRDLRQAAARKLGHPVPPDHRAGPHHLNDSRAGRLDRPSVGPENPPGPGRGPDTDRALLHRVRQQLVDQALHRLLIEYVIAMGILTLLSAVGGWMVAGRVLRPLKRITHTAQSVSQESLHHRIGLEGPDDELKELADTFDHMLGRLDAAFARQMAFVANASHELRTPLTIIRTEADVALAKRHPDVRSLLAGMDSVRKASDRSDRLIEGLLTLARVDRQDSHRRTVALESVVAEALQEARSAAEARSLEVVVDLKPASITGDARLLETLARNLLDNAIRYNRPEGRLAVRTRHDAQAATLEVENDGERIPPERAAQLTEPFQRLDRHHHPDGVGLGLSIVSAIVSAHDGTLSITAPGAGGLALKIEFRPSRPPESSPQPAPGRAHREPPIAHPRPV